MEQKERSQKTKKSKFHGWWILILIVVIFSNAIRSVDFSTDAHKGNNVEKVTERELAHGDVFEAGCYVNIDEVKIRYDGKYFIIINNSDTDVIVSCGFYGSKADGSYELVGYPAFYGIDEAQYEADKEQNGWALTNRTNRVKAHNSLVMTLEVYDISDWPDWDIDDDGYYDIDFTIYKQEDEDSIQTYTNAPKSDYYKLKAG